MSKPGLIITPIKSKVWNHEVNFPSLNVNLRKINSKAVLCLLVSLYSA